MDPLVKNTVLDVKKIREDFPILDQKIHGKPLVYFDNGATAQKPRQVIDSIVKFYTEENSNIHRGVHALSRRATEHYERARSTVQKHLGAASDQEIIFTRGTTESINLVASSFGKTEIAAGDEILVSEMEHHSNILPWQMLCEEKKAVLKYIPVDKNGTLRIAELEKLLSARTRLIAISHVSNTTGIINPVQEIIKLARKKNIPVLLDGAQAVPHIAVNVSELDCDFYCFSGHKIFAPTGIGVLYMKQHWMEKLAPYQVGGGTIKTVSFEKTEYAEGPLRFEAGTPNVEGAIGLAEALNYVHAIGLKNIAAYEDELLHYATDELRKIKEVTIYGDVAAKAAVISFNVANTHPFDVGTILDQQGIAVRTGHHCTQPLMHCFGIPGTVRVSLAFYNTKEEIDLFIAALKKAIRMLS
jgi:cysteine desulfurase/selenocysteine lyase